jgi:5'-methylthioadenosine phosphorylase
MLGVLGGTGVYDIENTILQKEHDMVTPFGKPSGPVMELDYKGNRFFFLPRHGKNHEFLPHEVNHRANIFALKSLGATAVMGISAVGSLKEEICPGQFAIPDQYFDFVRGGRENTFFGEGLSGHVSTAEPVCPGLTRAMTHAGACLDMTVHTKKTYACVDGPRLGTRAESFFLRGPAGCDLVGMTNVPEAFLAREAQICYATLTIVTDYDCWQDDPGEHVSVEMVFSRYGKNLARAGQLIKRVIENFKDSPDCSCRHSLDTAIITPVEALSHRQKEILAVLKR